MTAPTAYSRFTAPDKTFRCVYPSDWQKQATSAQAVASGVTFRKAGALIDINSDLFGSLMGDMARSSGGMGGMALPSLPGMPAIPAMPRQKSPIEALHDAGQKALSEKSKDYQEQKAQVLRSPLGEGRISEFTAGKDGMFQKQIHGYRVTILSGERRITVISQCPEADWPTLKPAFRKVIGSLAGES